MKELIAISTAVLALTTGGVTTGQVNRTSTVVQQVVEPAHQRGNHISVATLHQAALRAKAQADFLHQQELQANTDKVEAVIHQLKGYVGKTWYVFSGATPSGWDCSGLVMWTYEQLGVTLEHRASKQADAGTKVTEPKVGDIVAFTYKGSTSAYHVGIYVGNGNMVHAPKNGHRTSVESIESFAGDYSTVTYIRIIETI
jgi:cell wall-associated NlpC family hydrolase